MKRTKGKNRVAPTGSSEGSGTNPLLPRELDRTEVFSVPRHGNVPPGRWSTYRSTGQESLGPSGLSFVPLPPGAVEQPGTEESPVSRGKGSVGPELPDRGETGLTIPHREVREIRGTGTGTVERSRHGSEGLLETGIRRGVGLVYRVSTAEGVRDVPPDRGDGGSEGVKKGVTRDRGGGETWGEWEEEERRVFPPTTKKESRRLLGRTYWGWVCRTVALESYSLFFTVSNRPGRFVRCLPL